MQLYLGCLMVSNDFFVLLGMTLSLILVFEGILPFLSPQKWKKILLTCAACSNHIIRRWALIAMCSGVLIMFGIHQFVIN